MAAEAHGSLTKSKQHTSSHLKQSVGKEVKPFQQFLQKFGNDWAMTFAGVLAYNLLMSMLPIAIALVSILGFVLGHSNLDMIVSKISQVFPAQTSQQDAIKLALEALSKQAGYLAIIAVVLAVYSGSRLFIMVENCLDIVYRVRPRAFLKQNIIALLMFILFIILIPVMVFASTLPSFIVNFLGNIPAFSQISLVKTLLTNPFVLYIVGILGGLLAALILFEAIYLVVPNQKVSVKNSWRGALVAAIATTIYLNLFPLYSQFFLKNYVGQVGFAVILLLFFYYFAVILMLGAEVNAFFSEKVRPIPNDLATFVSTMVGTLNKDIPDVEGSPHTNPQPTENADRAHIASAHEQENRIANKNMQQQQPIAYKNRLFAESKKDHKPVVKKEQGTSKIWAVLSVAIGSALTVVIQLFQQRHHGK